MWMVHLVNAYWFNELFYASSGNKLRKNTNTTIGEPVTHFTHRYESNAQKDKWTSSTTTMRGTDNTHTHLNCYHFMIIFKSNLFLFQFSVCVTGQMVHWTNCRYFSTFRYAFFPGVCRRNNGANFLSSFIYIIQSESFIFFIVLRSYVRVCVSVWKREINQW